MMIFRNIFLLLLTVHVTFASPQRTDQLAIDRIQNVFGSPKQESSNIRGGFDTVVLPEPENLAPTESPMIITNNNGQSCKCVPYWMCEPENSPTTTSTDSRFFGEIDVRFTPDACQDVLDVCCAPNRETKQVITPPPPDNLTNRPSGCGYRNVNGIDFSLAGNFRGEAGFGEFPWTVALLSTDTGCLCGGSLIHPSIVLTGAHCVFNLTAAELRIRAGEWDTQTTKERLLHQERNVRQIITHQGFHKKSLANDIALLILDQPVLLDQHINVICLPASNYFSNSPSCYASGWGKDVFGKDGKYSVIMKKVELPMVPVRTCEESLRKTRLGGRFNLHNSFICAGGQENVDTCQGDGGSPLVCPIGPRMDNRYIQIGAVSWGIGCRDAIPGVYTNIPLFRDWIDRTVQDNGFDPNVYSFE